MENGESHSDGGTEIKDKSESATGNVDRAKDTGSESDLENHNGLDVRNSSENTHNSLSKTISKIARNVTQHKLMNMFGSTITADLRSLNDAIMECRMAFPVALGDLLLPAALETVELVCNPGTSTPVPFMSCNSNVYIEGDNITRGTFNIKISGRDRMYPILLTTFKLKQIRSSADCLEIAYNLSGKLTRSTLNELKELLTQLDGVVNALEHGQSIFSAPYAKAMEEAQFSRNVKNPVFRGQPRDIDVNFFIDNYKLVFRASILYGFKRHGRLHTYAGLAVNDFQPMQRETFRVEACVPWLWQISKEYEQSLCLAKKLRHKLNLAHDLTSFVA